MIPKEHYRSALAAQDACNLSGIVHSFANILTDLQVEAAEQGEGTEWVNNHPISILFADKIADLTCGGTRQIRVYMQAYNNCVHGAE